MNTHPNQPDEPAKAPRPSTSRPSLDSADLFGGQKEIQIRHEGVLYRLRITRRNKLILQK